MIITDVIKKVEIREVCLWRPKLGLSEKNVQKDFKKIK